MKDDGPMVFRPLMRSMVHCPWAMTLWGMQQALHLMAPSRTGPRAVAAVEAMNRAASGQMDETVARVYRTGERIQNGVLESLEALVFRGGAKPGVAAEAWRAISRPPPDVPVSTDLNRHDDERSF